MTGRDTRTNTTDGVRTRREVLATVGAAGTVALAGCGNGGDDGTAESSTDDDAVRVGVAIPQRGAYGTEGSELRAGYRLATRHINDGSGAIETAPFADLGDGLLDGTVELSIEDTGSSRDGARQAAETVVAEDDVDVLVGGASREEAVALQAVAAEEDLVYMGGFTPTNAMGGEHCSRYGFNEIHNPPMMANALRNAVAATLGPDNEVNFAQLYPDNDLGEEFANAFDRFADIGDRWFHQDRANVATRVGAQSYEASVEALQAVGPDVVILNYYGLDAANALRAAVKTLDDVEIVVPLMNRVFARNAGTALGGVLGTTHWLPAVGGEFTDAFVDSWETFASDDDSLEPLPSGTAHLAYVQLAQWAGAAQRAGSTDADPVIDELEGHSYDVGLGQETLRACDHQAQRAVPVVRGLPPSQQSSDGYLRLETIASNVGYGCGDGPAVDCSM